MPGEAWHGPLRGNGVATLLNARLRRAIFKMRVQSKCKCNFYISEISFNEENLSLIREICLNVLWFEKYIVNDGTPNNMRGESINITPARNKDGIVITCITQ